MSSLLSKNKKFTDVGGNVFDVMDVPSDKAVVWGEMFKERERKLISKHLISKIITFTLRDTFNIHARHFFHAKNGTGAAKHKIHRNVIFLHGLSGGMTSSWVFIKLAPRLFKAGFNVILLDMPNSIRSGAVKPKDWIAYDAAIICGVLDELCIPRVHICAYGELCSTLFRLMQRSPHLLEKTHILHNPILNLDDLFPMHGDHTDSWSEVKRKMQITHLRALVSERALHLWVTADAEPAATDTVDILSGISENLPTDYLRVSDLTQEDMTKVFIGDKIPIRILFPCEALEVAYKKWLMSQGEAAQSLKDIRTDYCSLPKRYATCSERGIALQAWNSSDGGGTARTWESGTDPGNFNTVGSASGSSNEFFRGGSAMALAPLSSASSVASGDSWRSYDRLSSGDRPGVRRGMPTRLNPISESVSSFFSGRSGGTGRSTKTQHSGLAAGDPMIEGAAALANGQFYEKSLESRVRLLSMPTERNNGGASAEPEMPTDYYWQETPELEEALNSSVRTYDDECVTRKRRMLAKGTQDEFASILQRTSKSAGQAKSEATLSIGVLRHAMKRGTKAVEAVEDAAIIMEAREKAMRVKEEARQNQRLV